MSVFAQVPSNVPTNGLIGYWPFTGNANDVSGNGNNGTVSGATPTNDRFGNVNYAYSFYGNNDYVEIATNNSSFDSQTYTISFWYKTNAAPYTGFYPRAIISRSNSSGSPSNVYDNYSIFEGGGTIALNYQGVGTLINSPSGIDWVTQLNNNSWHLLNVTVNTDSLKAYVDGILVNKQPFIAGISFQNYSISIGKSNHTFWSEYNGYLDDIGIWNRALTQQEVNDLYNTLNPTTAIIENKNDLISSMYPNPTNDKIHIDFQKNKLDSNYSLEILNTLGQVVFKSSNLEEKNSFDLSKLIKGIYFVRLVDAQLNTVNINKIILQ